MQYDIILVSVPYTIIEVPPLGIAVLKGAIESEGFKAKTIDLGIELLKSCKNDSSIFNDLQMYFANEGVIQGQHTEVSAQEFIDDWSFVLANASARWIGISVFSYYSYTATYLLCEKIKSINPKLKIVIGGPAVGTKISSNLYDKIKISSVEKLYNFGEILKKRNLIDHYILGDGEQALIDLLNDNSTAGIFHTEKYQSKAHPYSNFDDFDLSSYKGQLDRGYTQLPIFSSKGCVRNCDFCDVNVIQNKFRFRNGKNIVEEMIFLADRYGIRDFIFLDSLVNGSLTNLKAWVSRLAEYNRSNPDKKITWSASGWICRPIGQIKEDFYPVLAESGCQSVTIGAESGSNNVLFAMDKKTTVEALYYEIEQFRQNNIKFILLLIIGHWSETWLDFLDTASLMYRTSSYNKTGHLLSINIGSSFKVVNDTPADVNFDKNKIIKYNKNHWWTSLNPTLTAKERYLRLVLLEKLIHELNMPLMESMSGTVYNNLLLDFEKSKEFYANLIDTNDIKNSQHAQYYFENFEEFLQLIIEKNKNVDNAFNLTLELESSVDGSLITVVINEEIVSTNMLTEGIHTINLQNLPVTSINSIVITFSNKTEQDTICDSFGKILKDKFVLIKKFIINDIDLFQDQEFFYNKLIYIENNNHCYMKPGFWFNNSKIEFNFESPFLLWYSKNTKNFSVFTPRIVTESTKAGPKILPTEDYEKYHQKLVELLYRY